MKADALPRPCALITGASSGIGEALAGVFARQKIDLLLVARSEAKLQSIAERLSTMHGVDANVCAVDLSDPAAVEKICRFVDEHGLTIEYLVNNAGFGDFGPFHEADWEKNRQMIDVNIMALTHLTRVYLPGMVARGHGRVLNMASTAAFQPGPLMSVYYATKAYVLHFSEAIAKEVGGTGVTVTVYCPGPVRTGFQDVADIHESRLVEGRNLPGPDEVAADAYRAMMMGRAVKVHGLLNYLLSLAPRFGTRRLAVKVMHFIQNKRR